MNRNVYWVLELAVQPGRLNFRVRKRTRIAPVSSRSPCRFSSFLASH